MSVLEQSGSAMTRVQVARDSEQPGTETGVRTQTLRVYDQPQPGLLDEVLGNVAPIRQPRNKVVEPHVEFGKDDVERRRIATAQAINQRELVVAVHRCTNARTPDS